MAAALDVSGGRGRKEAFDRRHHEENVQKVPQILAIDEAAGNSVYSMAVETENGGNSGIDTIMRTLAEKRLIEDRAPTLDGSWMQRIMEARSANGNFVYSTMTPFSPTCGMVGMHGNMCAGAIAGSGPRNRNGNLQKFDHKIYLAIYYLGQKDLQPISHVQMECSND